MDHVSTLSSPLSGKSQDVEAATDNAESAAVNLNGGATKTSNSKKDLCISWICRPCLWIAVAIKWLPVAFISAVIGWSYYAFVFVVCFQAVDNLAEKVIFLFFYHIILVLFVWTYFKTIFAPKCETPAAWKLSNAMVERLSKALTEEEWKNLLELYVVEMEISVMQRSVQGAIRYGKHFGRSVPLCSTSLVGGHW